MNKIQSLAQFIAGVALLVLLVWGGYKLITFAAQYFSSLPKETAVIVTIGGLVIFWGAIIIAAGQREAAKLINRHKDKQWKSALYEEVMVQCLSAFSTADGAPKSTNAAGLLNHLAEFEGRMALRGSAKVIRKYNELKQYLATVDQIDDGTEKKLLELFLVFRNDLESGIGVTESDLRKMFEISVKNAKTLTGETLTTE